MLVERIKQPLHKLGGVVGTSHVRKPYKPLIRWDGSVERRGTETCIDGTFGTGDASITPTVGCLYACALLKLAFVLAMPLPSPHMSRSLMGTSSNLTQSFHILTFQVVL